MKDHLHGGLVVVISLCVMLTIVTAVSGIWFWAFNVETSYDTLKVFVASFVTTVIAFFVGSFVFDEDK